MLCGSAVWVVLWERCGHCHCYTRQIGVWPVSSSSPLSTASTVAHTHVVSVLLYVCCLSVFLYVCCLYVCCLSVVLYMCVASQRFYMCVASQCFYMCVASQRFYMCVVYMRVASQCFYMCVLPLRTSSMCRVGQNRIFTLYMAVCLVNSLPNTPYINRIYIYIIYGSGQP